MKRSAEESKLADEAVNKKRKGNSVRNDSSTSDSMSDQPRLQVLHPEVHGAEWHHHHRYNTRLQEEIEGPQPNETTQQQQQPQIHTQVPAEWHHHHRYNTRLQEEVEGPQLNISPNANLITPRRTSANGDLTPTEPVTLKDKMHQNTVDKDSTEVFVASPFRRFIDCLLLAVVLLVMGTLAMALSGNLDLKTIGKQGAAIRPYKNWHHPKIQLYHSTYNTDALKAKIGLVNDIASQFHKGPIGMPNVDDHSLFHQPLDILMGETTKRQLEWLHQVQKARNVTTAPAADSTETSWWEPEDWKEWQEALVEFVALLGQQIQG
mmetsp:Transcript_26499/g.62219  ORF Transcript_26499/g.62219 Transcript_26499/m.62219 type:complete len:320 (-) Transcript_26499:151-1110(-)